MITRDRFLGALSLLVGLSLGAAGGPLLRAQAHQGSMLQIGASCEDVDPFVGPFLAPTGVRLTLDVRFRSSVGLAEAPKDWGSATGLKDRPLFATVFALPKRWTAYYEEGGVTPVTPGALLGAAEDAPNEVAVPARDGGIGLDLLEGRRRITIDVLGPTDAEPATFSLRAVVRDVDGALLERALDDVCPLPAGSQHRAGGEG